MVDLHYLNGSLSCCLSGIGAIKHVYSNNNIAGMCVQNVVLIQDLLKLT